MLKNKMCTLKIQVMYHQTPWYLDSSGLLWIMLSMYLHTCSFLSQIGIPVPLVMSWALASWRPVNYLWDAHSPNIKFLESSLYLYLCHPLKFEQHLTDTLMYIRELFFDIILVWDGSLGTSKISIYLTEIMLHCPQIVVLLNLIEDS